LPTRIAENRKARFEPHPAAVDLSILLAGDARIESYDA
jgi:hypothetical protein